MFDLFDRRAFIAMKGLQILIVSNTFWIYPGVSHILIKKQPLISMVIQVFHNGTPTYCVC